MKKILLLIVIIMSSIALFGNWIDVERVFPSEIPTNAFGYSVSVSGDYAVIGTYNDDTNNGFGSAYIFQKVGDSWIEQEKLIPTDGATDASFGQSVSISGDFVVIGAHKDDDNGSESGSAYVFHRVGTNWVEQVKLTAFDGNEDDRFGYTVSINGDNIVVGAVHDSDIDFFSGSAYIFQRYDTLWLNIQKISASDVLPFERFGQSVSISGNYIVVGKPGDDVNGGGSGSAYIFQKVGDLWYEQTKIIPSDGTQGDAFGTSVSISESDILIGALGVGVYSPSDYRGAAYIFQRSGSIWIEQEKIIPSYSSYNSRFGHSVSISGDYAVIGAPWDDVYGNQSGSSFIFNRSGNYWTEEIKLIPSDGATLNEFGRSVSISENNVIIGSPDWYITDGFGSAYIFQNSVGIEDEQLQITNYKLRNSPNPFNPQTTISFSFNTELTENTEIQIFNVKGQLVDNLPLTLSGVEGSVTWNADKFSSGVYFYKLVNDNKTLVTKKMLLMK
jgi:hypothetical protein